MRPQCLLVALCAYTTAASPVSEMLNALKRQVVQTYDVNVIIYNSKGKPVSTSVKHVTKTVHPTTTLAAAPTASPTDYVSTALYHHNIHRANHSVPLLKWDTSLVASAKVLAATCHWGHNMYVLLAILCGTISNLSRNINGGGYGQNIAAYGSTDAERLGAEKEMAVSATNMWYNNEEPLYLPSYYGKDNPDLNTFDDWGHFTQMVWLNTHSVGCYTEQCNDMNLWPGMPAWYTVCNYYPPGTYLSLSASYATNVFLGNMDGEYGVNVFPPLKHKALFVNNS